MNARELVDHIRSGPAKLVLDKSLPRFRRRTRSNPCDFNEFLQALQSSKTIQAVQCRSQLRLSITEDEWVLLVKTLGSIKDIHHLEFFCTPGSRRFRPFQAVAEAVSSAHSLCKLEFVLTEEVLLRDPSGLVALANSLRELPALQEFTWADPRSQTDPDLVLRALPACPHLREVAIMTKYASADAMKNLLQLAPATKLHLVLKMDQWLAVADEIRQGRCNVQRLSLGMLQGSISDTTEAVIVVASAIRLDQNLKSITLQMENGYTDEAGVALAEAFTINKTLRQVLLGVVPVRRHVHQVQNRDHLGAQAYEAFSCMLRVNTSLVLRLPPFERAGSDERLRKSRQQMAIEQRLNRVGRGRLVASIQAIKEEWVDALHGLNSYKVNDSHSPAFRVSCLYSLLRLNPSALFVCISSSLNETIISVL
jgi:hypothetical protein